MSQSSNSAIGGSLSSIYIFYFDSVEFYIHVHTTFSGDLYDYLWLEIQARNYEHDTTNDKHYKGSVTKGQGKVVRRFWLQSFLP